MNTLTRTGRRERVAARRRGAAAVVVAGALALVSCSSPAEDVSAGGPVVGGPASTDRSVDPTPAAPDADLGTDGRSRVLFVGDSLMFGAVSALDAAFVPRGVETRYVGFAGTGLMSGQGWWNREISAQVEMWHPDVVVIEACCNYANGEPEYETGPGEVLAPDTEEMFAEWAALAADAVVRAGAGGAEVFWVTTPCAAWPPDNLHRLRTERFAAIVDALDVEQVGWRETLCPGGDFAATLEVDGEEVELRKGDGLHIAPGGNLLVAEETWETIKGAL